jgi:hypothetical protein
MFKKGSQGQSPYFQKGNMGIANRCVGHRVHDALHGMVPLYKPKEEQEKKPSNPLLKNTHR